MIAAAAIDLIVGGIDHIIAPGRVKMGEGVGACAYGLGFEGFQGKAVTHLIRENAQKVGLNGQGEHGLDQAAAYGEGEISGIQPIRARYAKACCLIRAREADGVGQSHPQPAVATVSALVKVENATVQLQCTFCA